MLLIIIQLANADFSRKLSFGCTKLLHYTLLPSVGARVKIKILVLVLFFAVYDAFTINSIVKLCIPNVF
jgi:hypothetical protein